VSLDRVVAVGSLVQKEDPARAKCLPQLSHEHRTLGRKEMLVDGAEADEVERTDLGWQLKRTG
jgi:hypothetical protein